jgi:NAD(P)-dependent dehydrogenase (short-subunit alcohol dehydrogenase family)
MSRIFITGSVDGLGRAAARTIMKEGHQVILHARSRERAQAVTDLAGRSAGVVIGDLSSAVETRRIAVQVNSIGRMDAVIHNAGTYVQPSRDGTPEGHARTRSAPQPAPASARTIPAPANPRCALIYINAGILATFFPRS